MTAMFRWEGPDSPSTIGVIVDRLEEYQERAYWEEETTDLFTKQEYLSAVIDAIDRALEVMQATD